jgi:alkylhydroperoxidase family enzyme
MVRVAQVHDCPYCVDINAQLLIERLGSQDKLSHLSDYPTSPLFSEKEKTALEYADAMTATRCQVTDELSRRLKTFFSDKELVELTGIIGFQNLSARFNAALGVPPQGLCQLLNSKE